MVFLSLTQSASILVTTYTLVFRVYRTFTDLVNFILFVSSHTSNSMSVKVWYHWKTLLQRWCIVNSSDVFFSFFYYFLLFFAFSFLMETIFLLLLYVWVSFSLFFTLWFCNCGNYRYQYASCCDVVPLPSPALVILSCTLLSPTLPKVINYYHDSFWSFYQNDAIALNGFNHWFSILNHLKLWKIK